MSDIPLTPEQRLFATEHHDLVYAFLNSKHLSETEFYDVIIFGYLDAVCDFLARKDLQRYLQPSCIRRIFSHIFGTAFCFIYLSEKNIPGRV